MKVKVWIHVKVLPCSYFWIIGGNYIGHVCFLEEEGKSLQETGLKRAKRLAKKAGVAMESIAIPLQIRDLSQVNCTEELPHIPGPDSGNKIFEEIF